MQKIAGKIIFLIFIIATVIFFADRIDSVFADTPLEEKLKGKILLQVEEKGEAWYVSPHNFERYYLGRPDDAFVLMQVLGMGITNDDLGKIKIAHEYFSGADSDGDGIPDAVEKSIGTDLHNSDTDGDHYSDMEELLSDYNPKGEGLIEIDKKLSKKLAGQILLQVEGGGEAWYVNPDNLKRYFLGRPGDAFELMRRLGLGISNTDLAKIKEHKDYSEKIVKEQTEPTSETKRRYYDRDYQYSFEYDNDFSIKKYPDNPNVIFLSDSQKDFFLEGRSMIMIVFMEDKDLKLENFKLAGSGLEKQEEKIINGRNTIEEIYKLDYTDKRISIVESGNGFLSITLVTVSGASSRYDNIYKDLINSVKFQNGQ